VDTAFVGTNDLTAAMKRAFVDGATFYTLAYTPDKNDNQTTYHHVEVKLNRGDVKLSYRRGYYYVVPKAAQAPPLRAFVTCWMRAWCPQPA
jgi:hypothetical protein